jgi:pSer/pThr/pTyr-binding forkhead associated (FHA) protein
MVDCSHCGTTVPSNFKFCGACGGAIAAEQAPEKAASEPSEKPDQAAQPSQSNEPSQQDQPASPSPVPAGAQAPSAGDDVVGRLIVIRPDGSEGPEIPLTSGEHTVGRDSDRKALSSDPFLSPTHAIFSFTGDGFSVRDESSLNGVFVRIREKIELEHGDMVRLGQELLRFELMSEVDSVLADATEGTQPAGSPNDGCWGRLCLVAGPDIVTRAFELGEDAVTLGRESGDILFRDDGFVSGKHARVAREGGTAVLEDLGSSNGTFRRIQSEIHVDDGDLLLMGQQLFRLAVL